MPMNDRTPQFHLLCMGRSSLDLYSNDVGAPFTQINSFAAYVGGSPTNICVGAKRLGLNSALLTAVGDDPVGDFILHFLAHEGIPIGYIPRKVGHRSSAVVLGIEPPDKFPLVFYRDNAADIALTIDDALAAPIRDCQVFQFAGTNLSKEPSRSTTLFAAEQAKIAGAKVVLDVDFRPGQWHDVRAFGVSIRNILALPNVLIGTEDEIKAILLTDKQAIHQQHAQESDTHVHGDTEQAIAWLLRQGPKAVILKTGAHGARAYLPDGQVIAAPGFPVTVYNILGAGDAFGGGFLYGYVHGWDWHRAMRLGNACGAVVVTQHGCANFMPTMPQIESFVAPYGGL
jgi:5-dehydro-2-deoxygluconokinase